MLDHKKWVKMVKISNASYENEIHRVDSPFNEDFKNLIFFCQGGSNVGERDCWKILGKWPKTRKSIVMRITEWSVLIGILASIPWYQSLCIALVFLYVGSNYLLKS